MQGLYLLFGAHLGQKKAEIQENNAREKTEYLYHGLMSEDVHQSKLTRNFYYWLQNGLLEP